MDYYVVAVSPHVLFGIIVEIGFFVSLVIRIVPETEWHGRRRRLAYQFSSLINYRISLCIVCLEFHSQSRSLQFTSVHWQGWASCGKTAVDVGAT